MNFISGLKSLALFRSISSVLVILLNVVQVRLFGIGWEIESYFVASTTYRSLISMVQTGQLSEIFVNRSSNNEGKDDLLNGLITYLLILATILSLVAIYYSNDIINLFAPGFNSVEKSLAIRVFVLLTMALPIVVFNSFMNVLLQNFSHFGKSEIAGAVGSAITLVFIVLFANKLGVISMVYGIVLGKVVELVYTIRLLRKIDWSYSFTLKIDQVERRFALNAMRSTLMYAGSTQLLGLVLTATLTILPAGVLASYNYVNLFLNKIIALVIMPFSNVYFVSVTNYFKSHWEKVIRIGLNSMNVVFFLSLAAIFIWYLIDDWVFELLFYNKDVDISALKILSILYLMLLPIQSLEILLRSYLMGRGKGNVVYFTLSICQIISVIYAKFFLIDMTSLIFYVFLIRSTWLLNTIFLLRINRYSIINLRFIFLKTVAIILAFLVVSPSNGLAVEIKVSLSILFFVMSIVFVYREMAELRINSKMTSG